MSIIYRVWDGRPGQIRFIVASCEIRQIRKDSQWFVYPKPISNTGADEFHSGGESGFDTKEEALAHAEKLCDYWAAENALNRNWFPPEQSTAEADQEYEADKAAEEYGRSTAVVEHDERMW